MLEVTGLGDRLKEARKAKGFTLDDLQEITKIQKRYLAGIENEEFSSMPGAFYVRAFIKQYAEAVDLDADEMLALYKGSPETVEAVEEERKMTSPTLTRTRSRSSNRLNEVMPKIIVALFIIVILLVMAFLVKHNAGNKTEIPISSDDPIQVQDQPKSNENEQGVTDTDDEKPDDETNDETGENEPSSTDEQQLSFVQINGADVMYSLQDTDTFQLEIRTKGPSWIGVMDENQNELTPSARTMEAGETVEIDATEVAKVRIRVGRTDETEIYVNGELLAYESDLTTQNIHIEFDKE